MKCFAAHENGCSALNVRKCPGLKCSFYKTPAKALESRRKAYARIASLKRTTQEYIAETYYDCKMPWLKNHIR